MFKMIKEIFKIGINILKHKQQVTAAYEIWKVVDTKFRVAETIDEKLKSKKEEFKKSFLEQFPELKDVDVDYYRDMVDSDVNKDKKDKVTNELVKDSLKAKIADLQKQNKELQDKLNAIQNTVAPVTEVAETQVQ